MTTKNPSEAFRVERMHAMEWIAAIESDDPNVRNRPVEALVERLNVSQLLEVSEDLDRFRRSTSNLYHRVRAGFLLSAIYRYFLPDKLKETCDGVIPFSPQQSILERRFSEAIEAL